MVDDKARLFRSKIMSKIMRLSAIKGTLFDYFIDSGITSCALYADDILGAQITDYIKYSKFDIADYFSDVDRDIIVFETLKETIHFAKSIPMSTKKDYPIIIAAPISTEKRKFLTKLGYRIFDIENLILYTLQKLVFLNLLCSIAEKKQVHIVLQKPVWIALVKNKSTLELKIIKRIPAQKEIREAVFYEDGYGDEYINECRQPFKTVKIRDTTFLADRAGKYVNVINGFRMTTDSPNRYDNNIFILGSSQTYGHGVDDANTYASVLQRHINGNYPDRFNVINCANGGHPNYLGIQSSLLNIEPLLNKNDIIVTLAPYTDLLLEKYDEKYTLCDPQSLFNRPHTMGEVFQDPFHLSPRGTKVIGDYLFETMQNRGLFNVNQNNNEPQNESYPPSININTTLHNLNVNHAEINDYIHSIKPLLGPEGYTTGSIVMNCNPFTYGHQYLIEHARKQVDQLLIFVVEEDKSTFPFADRIQLVRKGVSHLNNVIVVPSGKFIISQTTFDAYFKKEEKKDILIDSSMDVQIFAQTIAPPLNISIRFVGEEPLCNITRQYNNTMKMLLPQYGIKLHVIPRKVFNDQPISASLVRKRLGEKQFSDLTSLVPASTYNYLVDKGLIPTNK